MVGTSEKNHAILLYGGFASRTGGAFMHAKALSEELRTRGWSVTTITLDCLPLVVRYLPHLIERLINRLIPPLGFYYKGLATRILYQLFVKRHPQDLLVFEDIYLGWNSCNPSISLLHAVWSDNLQSYDLTDEQVQRLKIKEVASINRLSHPVVTVSEKYSNFITHSHFEGFDVTSLKVIELGLDINSLNELRQGYYPNLARSLIYCGTLEPRKNVYFMLEVFRYIAMDDPYSTLTIVGDGPDREGLEKYANMFKLNVLFLGRLTHNQVIRELAKSNIYIHTALKESFSFALLEAKLCGLTTCALSNLEVPDEFIDLGFEGFDPIEWSSRILSVKTKPDLKDFPNYSIERMTDRTLALVSMT